MSVSSKILKRNGLLADLLSGKKEICSIQQKQYIKDYLTKYEKELPNEPDKLNELVWIMFLASKFGIGSPEIASVVSRLCQKVELYRLVYSKVFQSHEFILQQYVSTIRDKVEEQGHSLRDLRDRLVQVQFLAGTVIGFAFVDGPVWNSGNKVQIPAPDNPIFR